MSLPSGGSGLLAGAPMDEIDAALQIVAALIGMTGLGGSLSARKSAVKLNPNFISLQYDHPRRSWWLGQVTGLSGERRAVANF